MTGAPASLLTGGPASREMPGTLQTKPVLEMAGDLLNHAVNLQTALVSQDIDAMERLLSEGERLASVLAAHDRRPAIVSCCAAPGTLQRLRGLHESSAQIVRARLGYLNALQALLSKSATYDTAGTRPYRARFKLSVKA